MKKTNIQEKFSTINEHWKPGSIAKINDHELRLAKIQGEFVWHQHDDTDELFIVNKGRFVMELRDQSIQLSEGDVFVVPRGVEHRPVAEEECEILMIEPTGTRNTGNLENEMTAVIQDL